MFGGQQQLGSTSDSEAMLVNGRQLLTGSSPHLAVLGYHRALSAPASAQPQQSPAPIGVDPAACHAAAAAAAHLFDATAPRPHTISSAYERCGHARASLSSATFEPVQASPPPPPGLPQPPPPPSSVVHLAPPGPPMYVHRVPGPPAGRGQRHHHREEVIYQAVLRTPGSPHQLQQHAINNGTVCDTPPGIHAHDILLDNLGGIA